MSKIIVSERAVRELVREMFSGDWERAQNVAPVNVSNVVDPSAALTDPGNPNYVPDNKVELRPALDALIAGLPDDGVGNFYRDFVGALEKKKDNREEKKMKRDTKVESIVRFHVRRMLKEAVPGKIGTAFEDEPQPGAVGASGKSGILSPGETVTPESDPKVKNWRPGLTPPSGWHVIVGQRGKESLAPKAAMPSDVKVTKVPVGYSARQEDYFKKGMKSLQRKLSGTGLDKALGEEPGAKPTTGEDEKSLFDIFSAQQQDAEKYAKIFLETLENSPKLSWSEVVLSGEFQKAFKTEFGDTFRTYAKNVGVEIRKKFEAENKKSASAQYLESYKHIPEIISKLKEFVQNSSDNTIIYATNLDPNDPKINVQNVQNLKNKLKDFLDAMVDPSKSYGSDPETVFGIFARLCGIAKNPLEEPAMAARVYNRPQIAQAREQWLSLVEFVSEMPTDDDETNFSGSVKDLADFLGISASEVINLSDIGLFKYVFGMIGGLGLRLEGGSVTSDSDDIENVERSTDQPGRGVLGRGGDSADVKKVESSTENTTTTESFSRAVNSYVNLLSRRGKLNPRDVRVLRENPEFVMDLPGFKEYFKRTLRG